MAMGWGGLNPFRRKNLVFRVLFLNITNVLVTFLGIQRISIVEIFINTYIELYKFQIFLKPHATTTEISVFVADISRPTLNPSSHEYYQITRTNLRTTTTTLAITSKKYPT